MKCYLITGVQYNSVFRPLTKPNSTKRSYWKTIISFTFLAASGLYFILGAYMAKPSPYTREGAYGPVLKENFKP